MKRKYLKLLTCVGLDAVGYLSYVVPGLGEAIDIVWAPVAGWLNYQLFKEEAGAGGALFTFIEEALPGMDFIPSFTITWFYAYVISKNEKAQKAVKVLETYSHTKQSR